MWLYHPIPNDQFEVKILNLKRMLKEGDLAEDVRMQPGDMVFGTTKHTFEGEGFCPPQKYLWGHLSPVSRPGDSLRSAKMKQQERALVLRDAATPKMTPRGLVAVLFRRKRTILLSFAALMIGTVLMIMVLPAQYQSDMTVLIERERFDPVVTSSQSRNSADNAVPQLARLSEQDVNSEVDLLQSTDLLRKVVLECKLYDRLQWWRVLLLGANTREKKIDMAINGLQNNLVVNPPNKSNLITITYSSRDPRNSVDVLNTLGKLYLQKHVEVHRPQAQYTFFQSEVDQYRKQLHGKLSCGW